MLWRAGNACLSVAARIHVPAHQDAALAASSESNLPQFLEQDGEWVICRVSDIVWRLNPSQFIDQMILRDGVFEPTSIKWLDKLIKPGMVVVDVGANFGYYTVQLSHLVGPDGQVHAFEPSVRYHERLLDHLRRNNCDNVLVSQCGLSDRTCELKLYGDEVSAALHWADDGKSPTVEEAVQLCTLDSYVETHGLSRLDFIKIDIDGHEPRFLVGASETLRRFQPILLMEFAQLNLMAGGSDVERLARQLTELGYSFYSDRSGEIYSSQANFLRDAMNCSHSVNVVCCPGPPRARILE
jgi:FkbM family methyltransferase